MKTVPLKRVAVINRSVASAEDCKNRPYVGLEHIEKDTGHFVLGFDPKPQDMLATNFRFSARQVLYGKLRPYLNKVVMPDFEGVCTTEILPILPIDDLLDRTYLWAVLLSPAFVEWASASVAGANLPRLSPSLLAEYEIPLPPLPEQKRIAGILSRADRLRRLRRYALEMSESYLQAVFLEMFGDPATNPMGWEMHRLGKHIKFLTSGPRGWADYYSDSGVRFIRSLDVQMNRISEENPIYVRPPVNAEASRTRVRPDDVLLTITGSRIGRVAPVSDTIGEAYVSQHVAIIRMDATLRPDFVSMFLSHPRGGQEQIARFQYGQTKPGLNLEQIRAFEIQLPPQREQERYSQASVQYDRLRVQQREALRQAEHLFQTLLYGAFRGEV